MRTTEEVLLLIPQSYREAALALGIARWKIILVIVVKAALKGIVTGILIALARVAGETAPLLFTALGNNFWNHNLKEPIAALPCRSSPTPSRRTTTGTARPGRERSC